LKLKTNDKLRILLVITYLLLPTDDEIELDVPLDVLEQPLGEHLPLGRMLLRERFDILHDEIVELLHPFGLHLLQLLSLELLGADLAGRESLYFVGKTAAFEGQSSHFSTVELFVTLVYGLLKHIRLLVIEVDVCGPLPRLDQLVAWAVSRALRSVHFITLLYITVDPVSRPIWSIEEELILLFVVFNLGYFRRCFVHLYYIYIMLQQY